MKRYYSKSLKDEAYVLAPEQLEVFKSAGYETPTPEECIADMGAAKIIPPEGARVYVAFLCRTGEFVVRVRSAVLHGNEAAEFIGEMTKAMMIKRLAEVKDPDRPKSAAPEKPKNNLTEIMAKLLISVVGNADKAIEKTKAEQAAAESSEEVAE